MSAETFDYYCDGDPAVRTIAVSTDASNPSMALVNELEDCGFIVFREECNQQRLSLVFHTPSRRDRCVLTEVQS
jgi:hypothetical protein